MRMGQFDPEAPPVHVWTGDEEIPAFAPLRVEEPALAGTPMPEEVVRARSKGMRARSLESPGWKIVKGDTAVVRGDIDAEGLKATAVYAAELNVMLRSHLGGGDFRDLFSVRLFREHLDYKRTARLAGAANAESYYDPRSSEIVLWFGEYATPLLFQRSFAHEFVHAYVDRVSGRTEPLWLMEGLAEWFSNIEWRGDIFVPGQMNRRALHMLSISEIVPIETLLTMGRDTMYGLYFAQYYAQAWSVVDYIMTRLPHGEMQAILEDKNRQIEVDDDSWQGHIRMMLGNL